MHHMVTLETIGAPKDHLKQHGVEGGRPRNPPPSPGGEGRRKRQRTWLLGVRV